MSTADNYECNVKYKVDRFFYIQVWYYCYRRDIT